MLATAVPRALLLAAGGAALVGLSVPLGALGVALAGGLGYVGLALPRPRGRQAVWLGVACALVVVGTGVVSLTAAAPAAGFVASYWAGSNADRAVERSTDFLSLRGATRTDSALDLTGDQFAVGFFNDAARFNFGPEVQPGRDQLPFTVRWQGTLQIERGGERRFVLDSMGPARAWLDGAELVQNVGADGKQSAEGSAALGPGQHELRVEYTRPEARVPRLRVQWQPEPGGPLTVVGDTQRPPYDQIAFALVLLAWLALAARQVRRRHLWRAALGTLPLIFLAYGMLLHAPLIGRTTILSGLDDWLIYESSARDILLNGPLMNGGQERAAAYYGQPLYPYVLAAAHWLTGEGLFGPLALQFAALGGLLALAGVLARRTFGTRTAGVWAIALGLVFVQAQNEYVRVARQLFNENLYMPLVMASLIALVGLARRPSPPAWWRVLLVGAVLGLSAIARSQFLAFVPLALLILLVSWRRTPPLRLISSMVLLVAGVTIVIAPVTARNWIVSGQFVPISASGGASLLEFHRPPPGLVDPNALQRDPLFEALHLDTSTRTVLAFARQDPLGYLATWLPLGAHSLGLPGRTGGGIYWPLLAVVLCYLAAFALPAVRRRQVWMIHAFVASHLLVLMLFEADTYGYRLVMPMYAPLLVVAAQAPLALARAFEARARPVAQLVAAVLVIGALGAQVRALAVAWPDRETSLLGLGGSAAHAAATAERTAADMVYVASVDGTPRRFGAGSLPGLRYPWLKWFDPTRSLPLPAPGARAVYALAELNGVPATPTDLVNCLGAPDASDERVLSAEQVRQQCLPPAPSAVGATFEGVARVDALAMPADVEAGQPAETRLLWQPLVRHPEPYQTWLHLEDPEDGTLWGNATLDLYPARQWEPGEALLSRLPLATDPTALPDRYRLTLGMNAARANAGSVTASWQGQRVDRVPVGTLTLLPSTRAVANLELPEGMLATPGVAWGGLELVAARPPATDAWPGKQVRVGLLWRAMQDAPQATRVRLRLVRESGEVVQESVQPMFGGRLSPSVLRGGSVVRDEQTLEVGPRVVGDGLVLEVGLAGADGSAPIGKLSVAGRQHVFETSAAAAAPEAVFGGSMALLGHELDPERARAGATLTVKLRWRAEATMERTYKVFVHVLDASGQRVLAQRDAEPLDGRAPTPGWVAGEVLADEYEVALPADVPAGDYAVEIGVYEERSGERLKLPDGQSRVILATRLTVR